MEIRPLEKASLKEALKFKVHYWNVELEGVVESKITLEESYLSWSKWMDEAHLYNDKRVLLGAFDQEKILGCIFLSYAETSDHKSAVEINGLWIDQSYRKKRISVELLKAGLSYYLDKEKVIVYNHRDSESNAYYRYLGANLLREDIQDIHTKVDVFIFDINDLMKRLGSKYMIRLLNKKDEKILLEYLYQEPSFNIFPIGDVEHFGFDQDFQRIYGEFDEDHILKSILLRYRESAIYYAHEHRFNDAYLKIFNEDPFEIFSGKYELLELIEPYLTFAKKQVTFFCKASTLDTYNEDEADVKIATQEEDYKKLYDLLLHIEEFQFLKKDKEKFVKEKMVSKQMGTTLVVENQGKVISTVAATAETTKSAMVVAVATHPKYRGQGYATKLMKALMKIYIEEKNKELCLFYDNPEAGKIYLSLGFKPMGKWTMFRK